MNKLALVILSIAFLAYNIPSVFSAGQLCGQNTECTRRSKNTECCLQNATAKIFYKTCQPVTVALLNATFNALKTLPETTTLITALQPTIDGLIPNVPLALNNKFCKAYDNAQVLLVKAGIILPKAQLLEL